MTKHKAKVEPAIKPHEKCAGCGRPTRLLFCDRCAPPPQPSMMRSYRDAVDDYWQRAQAQRDRRAARRPAQGGEDSP